MLASCPTGSRRFLGSPSIPHPRRKNGNCRIRPAATGYQPPRAAASFPACGRARRCRATRCRRCLSGDTRCAGPLARFAPPPGLHAQTSPCQGGPPFSERGCEPSFRKPGAPPRRSGATSSSGTETRLLSLFRAAHTETCPARFSKSFIPAGGSRRGPQPLPIGPSEPPAQPPRSLTDDRTGRKP